MEQIACSDRERSTLDNVPAIEVLELADRCWQCATLDACDVGKTATAFVAVMKWWRRPAPSW